MSQLMAELPTLFLQVATWWAIWKLLDAIWNRLTAGELLVALSWAIWKVLDTVWNRFTNRG